MPYCQNCGSPVFGDFCQNCGQSVTHIPTQPYPPMGPPRPLPKKAVWAMIIAIISVIMLFIAGTLAWWTYSMDLEAESMGEVATGEMVIECGLEEAKYEMEMRGGGQTQTQEDEGSLADEEKDVADTTGLLLWLSIIMMIIVVILVIVMIGASRTYEMARYTRSLGNLAILFTLIALLFALITPVYYMVAWPDAVQKDFEESGEAQGTEFEAIMESVYDGSFAGSDEFSETIEYYSYDIDFTGESTWGPGIGWFLAIICIVPVIMALVLVKLGKDEATRLAPSMPLMPQPQYGYGEAPQYQQPPLQPYPPLRYSQPTQHYPQPQQPPSYSQQPVQPPPNMIETSCPTCGHVFSVMKTEGLTAVQCPNCGVKGTLK